MNCFGRRMLSHLSSGEAGRNVSGYIPQVGYRVAVVFPVALRYRGDIVPPIWPPRFPQWLIGKEPICRSDLRRRRGAQAVLDGCDQTTAVGRRSDYAILLLLARLGLRGGEVVALQPEEHRLGQRPTHHSLEEGGEAGHRLPLPGDVGRAISRYLRMDRPRLFLPGNVSCPHGCARIGVLAADCSVISGLTRTAIQRAGVESARNGAHVFRHSLATAMLRQASVFG